MRKIWDAFLFLRPLNLFMIFSVFWVFEYSLFEPLFNSHGLGLNLSNVQLDLLALNTAFVAASGYLINDWYDRGIDAINRPERFLVRYYVKANVFFSFYISLVSIGFGIAFYLAISLNYIGWLWLYPLFVILMWLYAKTFKMKGVSGNGLVSVAIFCLPWLLLLAELTSLERLMALDRESSNLLLYHVLFFSLCMALANFAREVIKDAQDAQGDSVYGSQSIYVKYGIQKVKILCIVSVLALLGFEIDLIFESQWVTQTFLFCGLTVVVVGGLIIYKILISKGKEEFSQLSSYLKLLMLLGLLQVVFLAPN